VTRQIRLLGIGLMVCFCVLFVQLNRLAVFRAEELNANPLNTRDILRDFSQPRGSVSTADGVVIAESVPSGDRFEYQRRYPQGPLFAHVTGYFSFTLGSSGVERTYNDELAGRTLDLSLQEVSDLFVDKDRVGDLTLSVRADLQQIASEQLGEREGSVVALDPRTGEILTMVSFPTYDPNALASHDIRTATDVQRLLDADPNKPRLARSYQDRYFPGSTFKVVTATNGVLYGGVTADEPVYPRTNAYVPENGAPIRNFGGTTCGGALFQILRTSCNSAFAQMGVDTGADAMIRGSEDFGFNRDVPIDLTDPARSNFPTDFENSDGFLAQSSIGQYEVAATPLQMAMVAGAVAHEEGQVMVPHVLHDVRDQDGNVVDTYEPEVWTTAMDRSTAALMRDAMRGVVESGTATRLAVPGFDVGGKTGTAQLGTEPARSHAWIIGFGGPEGGEPTIAVAVIVEGQPGASEQTGGRVAAPIAQAVLAAYLQG
jgi:peptidoglycan glycosyltransferase